MGAVVDFASRQLLEGIAPQQRPSNGFRLAVLIGIIARREKILTDARFGRVPGAFASRS